MALAGAAKTNLLKVRTINAVGGVCLVWISACAKGGDPRPVCPYLTGSTGYPPWLSGLTAVQTADDPRTPSRR